MSVIAYEDEVYQKLFNTLVKLGENTHPGLRVSIINSAEVKQDTQHLYDGDEAKCRMLKTATFVRALCYANRLTEAANYDLARQRPATILPLELNEPQSFYKDTYSPVELLSVLGRIQYNCITNGGVDYTPAQIKDQIDLIFRQVATHIVSRAIDDKADE